MEFVARTEFNSVVPVSELSSGSAWPVGQLITSPGSYAYGGKYFDFTQDGMYFLCNYYGTGFDGGQLVVYGGDIPRLMSSFAWLVRYGRSDESKTFAQRNGTARERSIGMRCGHATQWVIEWCAQLGITARTVRFLTANTAPDLIDPLFVPWADGLDEGHVALEVLLPTGWALFDVPGNCAFKDTTGKFMSLSEVIEAGVDNCEVFEIAPGDSFPTSWSSTELQTEAYHNIRLRFHSDKWRRGIYQIPGIDHTDGLTYFYLPAGMESRESWLLSLSPSWRVISKSAWLAMFYP